jgi:hypothetical protein
MRSRIAFVAATATLVLAMSSSAPAVAQNQQCQNLEKTAQQELDSASSLKSQAAKQALQSGAKVLSNLGIQTGSSSNTEQAIQKGALAASSPQMQNAILIQLLSANAHLQELTWRGCKPSSG